MLVRKSGSRAVSLKSSALPEAISPAQCWSLGCHSPTRSGGLKVRTCWRRTSGWKSGLDSRAICLAAAYAATEKSQAYWRCGKSGPRTGKADRKMEDRNISVPDLSVSSFQEMYQTRISPAEGRMQQARAKPPKATAKPYTRHILGIYSGVQSHTKATSKPTDSQPIGTPKPPPCDPKATFMRPSCDSKARGIWLTTRFGLAGWGKDCAVLCAAGGAGANGGAFAWLNRRWARARTPPKKTP